MRSREAASPEPAVLGLAPDLSSPHSRFFKRFADTPLSFIVELENHTVLRFGRTAPAFHVTARSRQGQRALMSLNERRIAEAYLAGHIDITGEMLQPFLLRPMLRDRHPLLGAWRFIEPLLFGQGRTNQKAIAAHYEQDAEFFFNFLDREVPLYTQGIFLSDDDTLRQSALRKLEYCFDACRLKPGDHILEIGPGWGSWLKYASARGVNCSAISISEYSINFLRGEARRLGYDWTIKFCDLLEYRTDEKYDAIIMMGIIEHLPQYRQVLQKFSEMLRPGGRIFLDGSSAAKKYALSSTTVKHIFPGNHSPWVLHDFLKHLSSTQFHVQEMFDDRHSYFLTLRNWAMNWESNKQRIIERFGEYAFRRFRLYFWGTAAQFQSGEFGCYRMVLGSRAGDRSGQGG
jgi:cyclopropane-fatty-acyl-phospholipid synthase